MRYVLLLIAVLSLAPLQSSASVLNIDLRLAERIATICKFVQGKGHPLSLRLKGMAWCKVGIDYLPQEYSEQRQQVTFLYEAEEFQELKANQEFPKYLRQARRRLAEVSLGLAELSD